MTRPYDPTEEFTVDTTTAAELAGRPHSWREYEPAEFMAAYENGEPGDVRAALARVEDGRFQAMLSEAHRFFRALDADEREAFAEGNPDLMAWVNVYGLAQDAGAFEDYSPLHVPDWKP